MKKKKKRHPKLGAEFALVSQKNRVFKDKKKEEDKNKCRTKVEDE